MPIPAPAICDDCGTIFASGFVFDEGPSSGSFFGNKSGPCPNCGGMGSVPDGLYEFVGETLNIVSSWSPERIQRLAEALETARNGPNPRAAAEAVIAENEDLLGIANRLLVPRNAGEFWAFVAALLALFTLLSARQSDQTIIVNEKTIIEQITVNPPAPTANRPKPRFERRDIPGKRRKPRKKPSK